MHLVSQTFYIESKLKYAAWKTFYPEKENIKGSLAKITLHSTPICAAMLLFEAKAIDMHVMGCLQYLSMAFQMYYPNTPALAKIHVKAMESSGNYVQSTITIKEINDNEE